MGDGGAVGWAAARETAHAAGRPLRPRQVALDEAVGAVLAGPLVARAPLPPFATAAMDGYAVAGPAPWQVVGDVRAGGAATGALEPGTCVAISTGAPVPPSALAVLPVEHAQRTDGRVSGDVEPGRHIRRAGEECETGEVLLSGRTTISPAVVGLAAASGHDELLVVPRPRVAALLTGDELLASGLPGGGRVRDALGPQLPALVRAHGGELVGRSYVPDARDLLRAALLAADADVVVTTGASSVGPADHLRPLLAELGARVLVDGVACRPGHPQLLARLPDGRLVVGLPGNPLAALVAVVTVLAPLLAGLGGRPLPVPGVAVLAEPLPSAAVTRLVPVQDAAGRVAPVPHAGSAMLRGAAVAGHLAVVPPGRDLVPGDEVEVLPLAG